MDMGAAVARQAGRKQRLRTVATANGAKGAAGAGCDVARIADPGDRLHRHLVVGLGGVSCLQHQVSVGKHLEDGCGGPEGDLLLAAVVAFAGTIVACVITAVSRREIQR